MLRLDSAGYRYPSSPMFAAADVDLHVDSGELVLLTGPTGCGKSTVLRLAAGLVGQHGSGEVMGTVTVGGDDPAQLLPRDRVRRVGFVGQNPNRQVITGTLGDEIAFGLESAGWGRERIAARVREVIIDVGLDHYPLDRSTGALSGGERQRLVVGAALAAGAQLLLLDEPLAHLDPASAAELMTLLRRVADAGVAVLVIEHRLEPVLPHADRLVVLDAGAVVADGPATEPDLEHLRGLGLRVPGLLDAADLIGDRWPLQDDFAGPPPEAPFRLGGEPWITTSGLSHTYPGASVPALWDVSVTVCRGETIAVLGGNGAGKSTLLAALAGRLGGRAVRATGRSVRVPQDPDLALFCETVQEDLEYGPREARMTRPQARDAAAEAAAALSLQGLEDRPPQALSRGQRLRAAVGAALACNPDIVVLDEPTSGQDHDQVERMMRAVRGDETRSLVFATHDIDLALRHADRVWLLESGRIVLDASPAEALDALRSGPLLLPPLTAWCADRGLPPMTAAELHAALLGVS
jgi:energy-coupling factor transport system ATP-binding protein